MLLVKIAEAYGTDPKYVDVENGVYSLTVSVGAAQESVKVPVFYAENDDEYDADALRFLPGHAAIANWIMSAKMAQFYKRVRVR